MDPGTQVSYTLLALLGDVSLAAGTYRGRLKAIRDDLPEAIKRGNIDPDYAAKLDHQIRTCLARVEASRKAKAEARRHD